MHEPDTKLPYTLRPANPTDVSFIIESWLHQYRQTRIAAPIDKEIYFRWFRKRIIQILKNSKVIVAAAKEDAEQILAFAVYRHIGEVGVLSWIYTKETFRGLGIASILYAEIKPIHVVTHIGRSFQSHMDRDSQKRVDKIPTGLVYNPFLDQYPVEASTLMQHEEAVNIIKGEART